MTIILATNQHPPAANPPTQGWNKQAIANTILKTAAITAAAMLYLGNRSAKPDSLFEKAFNWINRNSETVIKICLGAAIAPEAYKVAKFVTYDYPSIGTALAGAVLGVLLQKHCNLYNNAQV